MRARGEREIDNESVDGRIGRLADAQFGVVARAQVLAEGFTPAQIRRRVESGRWDSPLPRVYRIAGAPPTGRQAAMAGALWAGAGALVSHATAAVLWGFPGVATTRIELWTARNLTSDRIVVHRGTRLDRADRTTLGPIPVTTPVRTLIDIAGRLEDLRLASLLEELVARELVDPRRLAARLEALRGAGRVGAGRLEALLEARGDGPAMESALETLVWTLIGRSGAALPIRQHWVSTAGGRYRLDFAWPEQRVAVECDGWEHHGRRRHDFGKDRARYAEVVAAGYRVLPVTWDAAKRDPDRVIRWLRDALIAAA
jgi:very-short-patch-repair endonuclease